MGRWRTVSKGNGTAGVPFPTKKNRARADGQWPSLRGRAISKGNRRPYREMSDAIAGKVSLANFVEMHLREAARKLEKSKSVQPESP